MTETGTPPSIFRPRLLLIAALVVVPLAIVTADAEMPTLPLDEVERYDPAIYAADWLTADRDSNGTADYAIQLDDLGHRLLEAMDFNYDGLMDDFYFYSNDVLQRQEIDSNYDQVIDIWIYMWHGVYIQRWERDTDFDGEVDTIQDYDSLR